MNTHEPDSPAPQIIVDEDWKERVQREKAELEAQSGKAAAAEAPQPETRRPPLEDLPRPDFPYLVTMLSTQALVALGGIPEPQGQRTPEPALARHFIDLLGVVEEKTRGNLTPGEARLVEDNLHQLRMAFVELTNPRPE